MRKPGDRAAGGITEGMTPRPARPAEQLAQQAAISVTIKRSIRRASITVKGEERCHELPRAGKRLQGVKVSDTVDITYTRAGHQRRSREEVSRTGDLDLLFFGAGAIVGLGRRVCCRFRRRFAGLRNSP